MILINKKKKGETTSYIKCCDSLNSFQNKEEERRNTMDMDDNVGSSIALITYQYFFGVRYTQF